MGLAGNQTTFGGQHLYLQRKNRYPPASEHGSPGPPPLSGSMRIGGRVSYINGPQFMNRGVSLGLAGNQTTFGGQYLYLQRKTTDTLPPVNMEVQDPPPPLSGSMRIGGRVSYINGPQFINRGVSLGLAGNQTTFGGQYLYLQRKNRYPPASEHGSPGPPPPPPVRFHANWWEGILYKWTPVY